ncbi:MAG: DUF4169 family protein [Pseudotabrizicola sp.]|uniref:DUF4169 family protein n=1 Tax=Pseudotabrizicola sp. TaxID=2939647 RepID=UPI00271DC6CB|nr:DUF4169 family protein [Pseudotabrizicola sp.]MDO8883379.1 DUF4169 family protein [Pseudotabrizicola sp.]MDP2080916.1 DUF4169 family protein [Pseudotabrizicola sp.]MDZ7572682.1 DUF4169 family protein [Pseudotabrizicola sp.]
MADIINLRQKKKQAARKAARAQGDENAAKFGLTRSERDRQKAEAEKTTRDHAAHKREP